MRTWRNDRGTGTLLNIDLMDKQGGMIQTTFFGDAAIKFNQMIKQGKTYVMRGGQIKIANKRYTTIPNDHCITFDANADIRELEDESESIAMAFNFTSIQKIKDCDIGNGQG